MAFQQITLTVVVNEEDAESVKREFINTLEGISEDYPIHSERFEIEDSDGPDSEDLYEYEDAA